MKKRDLIIGLIILAVVFLIYWSTAEEPEITRPVVVVYVSEDRVFSEPVLKAFEKRTGIRVKAVYDTEETKSTGVVNRLIAEKSNPQADVYWANEPIRAEVLKRKGVSAPYVSPNAKEIPSMFRDPDGYWTGFSARARVLVVHDSVKRKPDSILAYTDDRWKGQGVIANPLFGTTTAHIAALFEIWGEDRADAFMRAMKRNGVALSSSNGESADLVASGRYAFSLVDSDDAINRIRQGRPVTMVYPDQNPDGLGCFIVPNAVVLIKGAPHPVQARKLIDYLLSKETERKLAFADCAQIPLHPGVKMPEGLEPIDSLRIMHVDYARVAEKLIEIQPALKRWVME
ncbi:extracellular solute-binding protein [Hydrogenimonas sp.]